VPRGHKQGETFPLALIVLHKDMRWMAQKLALNIKQEFHLWRYSTPREHASQTRRLARPT